VHGRSSAPRQDRVRQPSTEDPGGIGGPGTAAIARARANAIVAATGERLRKLPFDPAQLKSA
jgi:isoquinoline 1-oxidoreductase beta subunit